MRFTIHIEGRHGQVIHKTSTDVLDAAHHAYQYLTFPRVIMNRKFTITDETGFDVTAALFKWLLDTAGTVEDFAELTPEQIQQGYEQAVRSYKVMIGRANRDRTGAATPIDAVDFLSTLGSDDFEAALAQLIEQQGDAPEGTG